MCVYSTVQAELGLFRRFVGPRSNLPCGSVHVPAGTRHICRKFDWISDIRGDMDCSDDVCQLRSRVLEGTLRGIETTKGAGTACSGEGRADNSFIGQAFRQYLHRDRACTVLRFLAIVMAVSTPSNKSSKHESTLPLAFHYRPVISREA